MVRRNAGDVVNIGTGWTQGSNQLIGGNTFAVYTQGQATLKVQESVATVLNRQLFYNRSTSTIFGDGSSNPQNAIASDKLALLPGQTTSFSNYTNYSKGLNGVVIDIANLAGTLTAADFQFAMWNGISSTGFTPSSVAATITMIPNVGVSGTTRIKIEFADNAIRNTWLRITMLANANTGLSANDVFYFGNAVGDMNVGNIGSPTSIRADEIDTRAVRQNLSTAANSVVVTNIFDLNKDGRVNAIDVSLVRQNPSANLIRFFTAPVSLRLSVTPTSRFSVPNIPSLGSLQLDSKESRADLWIDAYEAVKVKPHVGRSVPATGAIAGF